MGEVGEWGGPLVCGVSDCPRVSVVGGAVWVAGVCPGDPREKELPCEYSDSQLPQGTTPRFICAVLDDSPGTEPGVGWIVAVIETCSGGAWCPRLLES